MSEQRMSEQPIADPQSHPQTKSTRAIGPAVIIAAVVCGPGSILTSSKVGAQLGYSATWVLVLACGLMIGMVGLATRIGISFPETPCQEIANRLGRGVSVVIGIAMFLIIACFQSSNNIAVAASLEAFGWQTSTPISIGLLVLINASIIVFLYSSRQQYRVIESAMKALVFLMMIAFLLNCLVARPSLTEAVRGLVPSNPGEHAWLLVALTATTFSVAAAFYQAYLVREKNWTESEQHTGTVDSIVGVVMLGMISLVIMMTSAAIFHHQKVIPELNSAADVALQLKPMFGVWAQAVFGIGIFAGAISSFLVNALIGGHILADGCGLGDRIESPWTRHFTSLALLLAMLVAIVSISTGMSTVTLIVFAQMLSVIGVPALALTLIYLGIIKRRENPSTVPLWLMIAAIAGFLANCLIATGTVYSIIDKISKW